MKNIVILGAGVAAAPLIRQIMRLVVLNSSDYKLIVVSPNTHWLFPIAMPRVVVPGQLEDGKVMPELAPIFKQYPAEKFEHVLGKASSLNPEGTVVTVDLNAGGSRTIDYNTLFVTTGSSTRDVDVPWKILDTTEKTKANLRRIQDEVSKAKVIVVAGGGATGTETAAELAFEYGKAGKKEIHFVFNTAIPLPGIHEGVRKASLNELKKLKVKLVPNSTVSRVSKNGSEYVLEISDKSGKSKTINAGAYIPATGVTPNTSFAPAKMLDSKGFFNQTKTLQHPSYPNIFIIGDAGNLENCKAFYAANQAGHLIKHLPDYFTRGVAIPEYAPDTKGGDFITLGRSRGAGHMGGWKLPSLMVWFFKGKTMMTDGVPDSVKGFKAGMTTFEK